MNNDITPEEKNIRVVQNILDTCSSDLAYMRQKAFDRNTVNIYPRFLLLTLHAQRWLTEGAHSIRLINKAFEYGEFISRKKVEELEKRLAGVKDIMTIEKASWYTGMSKSYLYKLTSKNMIPYYKPLGKMVYFEKSELDNWLRQNHV